jgi:copper chaperone NosL
MKSFMVALGVAVLGIVGSVVFLWPSQQTGPEPITYGRDACAHCRMHISQPGFAGELRDTNGVLTKYDDIGCLLHAMVALHHEVPEAWVEDHDGGRFLPLLSARLVRSERVETPMGYGIVAFKDEDAAQTFARAQGGEVLALEDILRQPARIVPVRKMHASTTREVGS